MTLLRGALAILSAVAWVVAVAIYVTARIVLLPVWPPES